MHSTFIGDKDEHSLAEVEKRLLYHMHPVLPDRFRASFQPRKKELRLFSMKEVSREIVFS